MRQVPWAALLWPGLPYILAGGSFRALGVSVTAAAGLNLLLAATFLWDELLAPEARNVGWVALAVAWVGAAVVWVIQRRWSRGRTVADALVSFQAALEHYLRGDWFQTERSLYTILEANPEDVEARLLLATLLRHTNRRDEALRELQRLASLPGSAAWRWEIEREMALLEQRSEASTIGTHRNADVASEPAAPAPATAAPTTASSPPKGGSSSPSTGQESETAGNTAESHALRQVA